MKKKSKLLIPAIFLLSATIPSVASASSVSNIQTTMPTFFDSGATEATPLKEPNVDMVKDLEERKEMLGKTLFSTDYELLSLSEKNILLEKYFSVQGSLYKEKQKRVLSQTDPSSLTELTQTLSLDTEKEDMYNKLLTNLIKDLQTNNAKNLPTNEFVQSKESVQKTLVSYKEYRDAGRNLETMIKAQTKVVNATHIPFLKKMSLQYELNGQKEETLAIQRDLLKITEGNLDVYMKVSQLLAVENKQHVFIDREAVELTLPLLTYKSKAFMSIQDIGNLDSLSVTNTEKFITIQDSENLLVLDRETNTLSLNGTVIGNKLTIQREGVTYFPFVTLFELLNYNVTWKKELHNWVLNKQIYPLNEIDVMPVDQLMTALFNE